MVPYAGGQFAFLEIITSMQCPRLFPRAVLLCTAIMTALYGGLGAVGYWSKGNQVWGRGCVSGGGACMCACACICVCVCPCGIRARVCMACWLGAGWVGPYTQHHDAPGWQPKTRKAVRWSTHTRAACLRPCLRAPLLGTCSPL